MEYELMNILVSFLDRRPCEQIAWFARRTLGFALDRFSSRIAEVALRVRDENGPRGGEDQQCSLAIRVVGGQDVFLQDNDAKAERAVHRLARRAARLLGTAFGKAAAGRRAQARRTGARRGSRGSGSTGLGLPATSD
jgi:hypothetical protein